MRLRAKKGEDLRDRMRARERFTCTKETPWSGRREDAPHGVQHVDAREVESGSDYLARFECPHCGTGWTMELPE